MNEHRPFNIWDLSPGRRADFPDLGPLVKESNANATEAVNPPNEPKPHSQTTNYVGNDADVIENSDPGPLFNEAFVASTRIQAYPNSRDGRFVDPFSRRSEDFGSSSRLDDNRAESSRNRLIGSSLRGDDIASSRFIDNQPHHGSPSDDRYYDARLGTEPKSLSGSRHRLADEDYQRRKRTKSSNQERPVAVEAAEDDYELKRGEGYDLDRCVDDIGLGLRICKESNGRKIDDEELRGFREALHKLPYMKSDAKHRHKAIKVLDLILRDANVPDDIIEDARYLILRWGQGDFNVDLIRGIEKTRRKKSGKSGKKTKTTTTSSVLNKEYRFLRDATVPGSNGLVMGQWWPLQICALRDGAHGELEAGISVGQDGAAVSVVLSGGQKDAYPNKDDLNVIGYCGTRGTAGRPTTATKAMIKAKDSGQPVRVLRSSKSRQSGKTNYAPAEGIRYDGLYNVISFETIEKQTEFYRFKLERCPGQSPVRWKDWPVKPTTEDRAAWEANQTEWKIHSLND
jgi:hypothetical protein